MSVELVVWPACEPALFALFLSMPLVLAPTTALLCSKRKNKALTNPANGSPKTPTPTSTLSPVNENDNMTLDPKNNGTNMKPRTLLPSNPAELKVYKRIVLGETRPPKDNETQEECESDWGSVQIIEKAKHNRKKAQDRKKKKQSKPRKQCEKSNDNDETTTCQSRSEDLDTKENSPSKREKDDKAKRTHLVMHNSTDA